MDEQKILIKFEGATHQVDLNTLTSSLLVFSNALKELKKEYIPDGEINIRIEALAAGSFEIHTVLQAVKDNSLFSALSNIGGAAECISGAYKGVIALKRKLQGRLVSKEIEKDDKHVEITTSDGNIIVADKVVYNIFSTNQPLHDLISEQFRILDEDPAVEGLTISDDSSETVPRSDFSSLAERIDLANQDRKKEIRENQDIKLIRPVLEHTMTRRWEFIWNGSKISATIADDIFLKNVASGAERFGAGDSLKVDLAVFQVYNRLYDAWLHDTYQIVKVHSHTERQRPPIQGSIDGM